MPKYSDERRAAVLKKLLPPLNEPIAKVSAQENIGQQTLYNWRAQARREGVPAPGPDRIGDNWSGEAKFAVAVETATLDEQALSEYCRTKGLYVEQVKQWRQDCIAGAQQAGHVQSTDKARTKADRKKIRALEKELLRKERALAETAALLVLRKKLNALLDSGEGE